MTGGGANHSGELDVGNWKDIASLSAGPEHTVGVKTDGTAVAAGIPPTANVRWISGRISFRLPREEP